jgi:thiamine transport system substrate-binding protein
MGPTVEPDPDNAGGGKYALIASRPPPRGLFFILTVSVTPNSTNALNVHLSFNDIGVDQMKKKMVIICIWLVGVVMPAFAAEKQPVLNLMTHDSFAVSQALLDAFQTENGVTLKIIKGGDAGVALNQAILSKANPMADVFFGVDNTFMTRALKADIFEPYSSPLLDKIPVALQLDPLHRLLPVDFGDVCLNYDKNWFKKRNQAPPRDLADLIKPSFRGLTVVENPATSSPGLAFLLATIGKFGLEGYLDFWKKLRENDLYVSKGWSDAYYGQFSHAKGGTRPIVVSYASSPAAEMHYSETPLNDTPTAAVLTEGCAFRQIEFVGILKGTKQPEMARRFVDFMLGAAFQQDIPLHMWVFPADPTVPLPQVFEKYTRKAVNPVVLSPEAIEKGREKWINDWTEVVLR